MTSGQELINVLSLGAGVQSTTVLLMSLKGELPPLDYVVFADTGWEPRAVYEHLERLQRLTTIHVVRADGPGIKQDALTSKVRGTKDKGQRWASLPYYTLSKGGEKGMVKRQCTSEYKIRPIERFIRQTILGRKPRQHGPKTPTICQWYGISLDEMRRMARNPNRYTVNYYPLVEQRRTRAWCLAYLTSHGWTVPRSACLGCPFKHDREWRWLHDTSPEEWQDAVEFDRQIRKCGGVRGDMYLHGQCVPLDQVDLLTDIDRGQMTFDFWDDECTGMCGV